MQEDDSAPRWSVPAFTMEELAGLSFTARPTAPTIDDAGSWREAGAAPIGELVWRPAIRSRNGIAYLSCRSWRSAARKADLAAFKALKQGMPPARIEAIGAELAAVTRQVMGTTPRCTVPVTCGHSRRPDCLSVRLAGVTAAALGIEMVEAFAPRFMPGVSHPKENRKLPPLDVIRVPKGPALVVDDVATSGFHIEEAVRTLRDRGTAAIGLVWIGGITAG